MHTNNKETDVTETFSKSIAAGDTHVGIKTAHL